LRNDEFGVRRSRSMGIAEDVIGRAFARPVGSAVPACYETYGASQTSSFSMDQLNMTAIRGAPSEQGAGPKMPPGVLVEGPVVDAKFAIPMSRSAS
jgi:hypothetical protein